MEAQGNLIDNNECFNKYITTRKDINSDEIEVLKNQVIGLKNPYSQLNTFDEEIIIEDPENEDQPEGLMVFELRDSLEYMEKILS